MARLVDVTVLVMTALVAGLSGTNTIPVVFAYNVDKVNSMVARCRAKCLTVFQPEPDANCFHHESCASCWRTCRYFYSDRRLWERLCVDHRNACDEPGCQTACKHYRAQSELVDATRGDTEFDRMPSATPDPHAPGSLTFRWPQPVGCDSQIDPTVYTVELGHAPNIFATSRRLRTADGRSTSSSAAAAGRYGRGDVNNDAYDDEVVVGFDEDDIRWTYLAQTFERHLTLNSSQLQGADHVRFKAFDAVGMMATLTAPIADLMVNSAAGGRAGTYIGTKECQVFEPPATDSSGGGGEAADVVGAAAPASHHNPLTEAEPQRAAAPTAAVGRPSVTDAFVTPTTTTGRPRSLHATRSSPPPPPPQEGSTTRAMSWRPAEAERDESGSGVSMTSPTTTTTMAMSATSSSLTGAATGAGLTADARNAAGQTSPSLPVLPPDVAQHGAQVSFTRPRGGSEADGSGYSGDVAAGSPADDNVGSIVDHHDDDDNDDDSDDDDHDDSAGGSSSDDGGSENDGSSSGSSDNDADGDGGEIAAEERLELRGWVPLLRSVVHSGRPTSARGGGGGGGQSMLAKIVWPALNPGLLPMRRIVGDDDDDENNNKGGANAGKADDSSPRLDDDTRAHQRSLQAEHIRSAGTSAAAATARSGGSAAAAAAAADPASGDLYDYEVVWRKHDRHDRYDHGGSNRRDNGLPAAVPPSPLSSSSSSSSSYHPQLLSLPTASSLSPENVGPTSGRVHTQHRNGVELLLWMAFDVRYEIRVYAYRCADSAVDAAAVYNHHGGRMHRGPPLVSNRHPTPRHSASNHEHRPDVQSPWCTLLAISDPLIIALKRDSSRGSQSPASTTSQPPSSPSPPPPSSPAPPLSPSTSSSFSLSPPASSSSPAAPSPSAPSPSPSAPSPSAAGAPSSSITTHVSTLVLLPPYRWSSSALLAQQMPDRNREAVRKRAGGLKSGVFAAAAAGTTNAGKDDAAAAAAAAAAADHLSGLAIGVAVVAFVVAVAILVLIRFGGGRRRRQRAGAPYLSASAAWLAGKPNGGGFVNSSSLSSSTSTSWLSSPFGFGRAPNAAATAAVHNQPGSHRHHQQQLPYQQKQPSLKQTDLRQHQQQQLLLQQQREDLLRFYMGGTAPPPVYSVRLAPTTGSAHVRQGSVGKVLAVRGSIGAAAATSAATTSPVSTAGASSVGSASTTSVAGVAISGHQVLPSATAAATTIAGAVVSSSSSSSSSCTISSSPYSYLSLGKESHWRSNATAASHLTSPTELTQTMQQQQQHQQQQQYQELQRQHQTMLPPTPMSSSVEEGVVETELTHHPLVVTDNGGGGGGARRTVCYI